MFKKCDLCQCYIPRLSWSQHNCIILEEENSKAGLVQGGGGKLRECSNCRKYYRTNTPHECVSKKTGTDLVTGESSSSRSTFKSASIAGKGGKILSCVKCKVKYRNSNQHTCDKNKELKVKPMETCVKCCKIFIKDKGHKCNIENDNDENGKSSQIPHIAGELYFSSFKY